MKCPWGHFFKKPLMHVSLNQGDSRPRNFPRRWSHDSWFCQNPANTHLDPRPSTYGAGCLSPGYPWAGVWGGALGGLQVALSLVTSTRLGKG